MLTLGGKLVKPQRPKLAFAVHAALSQILFDADVSKVELQRLMGLAAAAAAMVPTEAGPMPLGDPQRALEWSAAAYDALATAGATDAEIVQAGADAYNWLTESLPRRGAAEGLAGNSSAQTEPKTSS